MKRILTIGFLLIALLVPQVAAQKLVEDGPYTTAGDWEMKLDNYFIELQISPAAQGYIFFYGPKRPFKNEVKEHMKQMSQYINFRKFPRERITFINVGYRDSDSVTLSFWMAQPGDETPKATDILDLKSVKFKKGSFKPGWLYACCKG